jgi:Zn-dependent protease
VNEGGLGGGSIRIGNLWGVEVKLHVILILWVGFRLLGAGAELQQILIEEIVLVGSVFLHELGHCAGARVVGGQATEILLWPLGGLTRMRTPNTAKAEFVSTAAGPLVNLLLFGLSVVIALVGSLGVDELSSSAAPSGWILWYLGVINLLLFLFNVLPAYPMDGGRIFRSILWPIFGWRTATLIATGTAILFGLAFVGGAVPGVDRSHGPHGQLARVSARQGLSRPAQGRRRAHASRTPLAAVARASSPLKRGGAPVAEQSASWARREEGAYRA